MIDYHAGRRKHKGEPLSFSHRGYTGYAGSVTNLCVEAYESPYRGKEWEEAINKAIEKLEPYLKGKVLNIPEK